jgi:hypothetical protein
MTNRSEDEPAELSSPACSMSEADDTHRAAACHCPPTSTECGRSSRRPPVIGWSESCAGSASWTSEIPLRLQLAFELVEEAPVCAIGDDLLGTAFDRAQLVQA